MGRARRHRQAVRLRRRRRHRRVPARATRAAGDRRQPRRPRPLRPHARAAVPDRRRGQRRLPRRRPRGRAALRRAHDRELRPPLRRPGASSGSFRPGAARSSCRGSPAPQTAVRVIVENAMRQNRMLTGRRGGRARARRPVLEPVEFLDESIAYALELAEQGGCSASRPTSATPPRSPPAHAHSSTPHSTAPPRPLPRARPDRGRRGLDARGGLPRRGGSGRPICCSRRRRAPRSTRSTSSSGARRRRPGIPDAETRRIRKVGIVGAGLMASQLATLFLRRLEVPIVLRDVREEAIAAALDSIRGELAAQAAKGRYDEGKARFLGELVDGLDRLRRLRRLRPRARGGLRGDPDQAAGLRRGRGARLARLHPRDEHVGALGHGDGRRARAPGAARRHALLQPGRADAARRAGRERRRPTTSRSRPRPASARSSASAPCPSATRPGSSSTGCSRA